MARLIPILDLSQTDDRYKILYDPVKIGPVIAPNRFYAVAPGIIQSAVFSGQKAARTYLNGGAEPAMKRERGMLV